MNLKSHRLFVKILLVIILVSVSSCTFQKEADAKFGDQHFKNAIALIEMHKIRFGSYPESLNDLKYIGDWDKIVFSAVQYKRLDNGYELNLTRGWIGQPELNYPDEFWKDLGLVKSNLKQNQELK